MAEFHERKYIVIPTKYMLHMPVLMLQAIKAIMTWLRRTRVQMEKSPNPEYIVVKRTEPYADEFLKRILEYEDAKEKV